MKKQMTQRPAIFQVAANRKLASVRLRYVEMSAPDTAECRLCMPKIQPISGKKAASGTEVQG